MGMSSNTSISQLAGQMSGAMNQQAGQQNPPTNGGPAPTDGAPSSTGQSWWQSSGLTGGTPDQYNNWRNWQLSQPLVSHPTLEWQSPEMGVRQTQQSFNDWMNNGQPAPSSGGKGGFGGTPAPINMPGQIGMPAGPGYMQPTPLPTPTPAPINMPGQIGMPAGPGYMQSGQQGGPNDYVDANGNPMPAQLYNEMIAHNKLVNSRGGLDTMNMKPWTGYTSKTSGSALGPESIVVGNIGNPQIGMPAGPGYMQPGQQGKPIYQLTSKDLLPSIGPAIFPPTPKATPTPAPINMPGQIGMPAGPGYMGGLKPAPVNYRPPVPMTNQQIVQQVGMRPNPVKPKTAQKTAPRTVYGPRAY